MGGEHAKVRGAMITMIWKDMQDVCPVKNVHKPSTTSVMNAGEQLTCLFVDYSRHMGYNDKEDTEWLLAIQLVRESVNYLFTCQI
jgi:hypothetical protein